ncbi:MAG TPA: DUF1583 domain-containing protein, partial [Lacipirellulaceae bacterium]|nr:DUF1583 domain-containing protein [Lacipirellulaceae bacterium]
MLSHALTLGRWLTVIGVVGVILSSRIMADDAADSTSEDEAKQAQVAERFLTVLEKSPRRGTALDRVYGYHVEFGTLDKFLGDLRERTKKSPDDGTAWMLLGLFEAHRGEDGNAVDAFQQAEKLRPQDALAPYYLGQELILIGQPEQAVDAFERAIARNPPRTDLLEIFQQLGRVHQRAQHTDAALAVWNRLEALFPNDPRVQEQIATTLVEEGQYALALPRYEQLVTLVHDDYRKVTFQIEVAELKVRLNRRDEGLQDLEHILSDLNPESWLYHDVRRRIEEVFLRTGDQDGLVKYYEKWSDGHPEDIDAMARLAKFLATSARVPEATKWMEKALKLAPKRTELRRAFIEQLIDEQRFPEALAQYAELAKADPSNADVLRDWGKLVLRDKSQDMDKRKAEATRIWRQMVAAHANDAVTISQVADLFRQANINDEAIELYSKAIELKPDDPQYREYLGEFYHVLKRPEDAQKTWKAISEGSRHTAVNAARLAQVYNSFAYADEATAEIAEACKLDPKDFALKLTAAEYFGRSQKYDKALEFIADAEKLAANDDERESVMKARIEALQSNRELDTEIDRLAGVVGQGSSASLPDLYTLARYYEADQRWTDASETIARALAKDANSIRSLATAARIAEQSGDFARAAEIDTQLAQIDRRSRGDYLMSVARLESQMGKTDEALKAGKDLIASAPGNTDNYEFYAQLCFRLGKPEEGLDALRKAVRINPTEPHLTTALGAALADQFRADEAIEVYWRAYDRTEEIDDKTSLTAKLADLYLQTNQFDKLIERLERERKEDAKRRAATICIAQAYNTAGDYGTARREMESLLSSETQDTNLLQQLSKLCEQGAELDAAVDYQRRLVQIAPGQETESRLANLLQARGDHEEANEIYVRLTQREEDPGRLLKNLDSLLTQSSYESVIAITEPRLSQQHDDWELLYREIVAWASLEKQQEAKDRCRRLLALRIPHDKMGVSAAEKFKQAEKKAKSDQLRGVTAKMPTRQSPLTMLNMSQQVRQAVGFDTDRYYYGNMQGPQRPWMPDSFGVARMAAYAWELKFEEDDNAKSKQTPKDDEAAPSFVDPLEKAAFAKDADRDTLYDWLYVESIRGNHDSLFRVAKQLAQSGGREEQNFYLTALQTRTYNPRQQRVVSRSGSKEEKKKPLTDDELDLMLKCYDSLNKNSDANEAAAAAGGQIAFGSNGQAFINIAGNWVQLNGCFGGNAFLGVVLSELTTAGRDAKANELLNGMLTKAKSAKELSAAMNLEFAQEKYDQLPAMYAQWVAAAKADIAKAPIPTARQAGRQQSVSPLATESDFLMQWMGKLGPDEENAQILSILDPALDLAIEQAKKACLVQTGRPQNAPSSQQQYFNMQFNVRYGKEQSYTSITYPQRPTKYVDQPTIFLLREVYEVFKHNDVLADLPEHLRKRLKAASPDNQPYEQLMLGYVLWWNDEHEEAAQLLSSAAEHFQDDPAFRLEMASLYETLGDLDKAMEIVESIAPRDQKLVQQRETLALQLSERLGDVERARKAAERLFGLRLDNESQLQLVDRMRRLGLNEMAEAVVSRVQQRSGNQTGSLATLMAMYQGQGKIEMAQQLAHTILRRTTPPSLSANGSFRAVRFQNQGPGNAGRTQALQLLQQTGALKTMTQQLETQLAQSPNSPRLYEQLIEYYQVSGAHDKTLGLLQKAIEQRPDNSSLRYQLAKQYEQSNKLKEACDQYLEIIKQKPALLMEDFWEVRNVFQRAQRSIDLVKALDQINLKSFNQQPYYVIDLVGEMLQNRGAKQNEEDTDLAINLFEKVFDAYPSYRSQLISRIYDEKLWKKDRIYNMAKRGIIPTGNEAAAQPWFGLDSISSYSTGGTVNSMFHQLLTGVTGTDKVADLRATIEKGVNDNPEWVGGQAMLALMDLKTGKKDEGKQKLEKLVAQPALEKTMPADAGWIIGQELDQFDDTTNVALKLYENALTSIQQNQNQLQYSPVSRLIKIYAKLDRKNDARQLLLKQLHAGPANQFDPRYSAYMRAENSVWAGNQLLEIGSAVDAVRIYRDLMDDSDALQQAGTWYGNRPDYFVNQAQNGLKKALAAIKDVDAADAVKQLLAPAAEAKPDEAVLDLMVAAPDPKTIRTQHLDSGLLKLLNSLSQNDKISKEIEDRLAKLATEHPDEFSIPIVLAIQQYRSKDDHAIETAERLAKMATDKPLDEIPAGHRPNSRQRREAALRIPLWFVARETFSDNAHKELAEKLAADAIEAARRQVDNKYYATMMLEWGQQAADAGDKPTAEKRWTELLAEVTKRPERHAQQEQGPQPGRMIRPAPAAPVPAPATQKSADFFPRQPSANAVSLLKPLSSLAWFTLFAVDAPPAAAPKPATPVPTNRGAKPAGSPTGQSAATGIPPLTISQFRLATQIAIAAAENNMPELSQKAVQKAMAGGIPVPDPPKTTTAQQNVIMRAQPFGDAPDDVGATEAEVAVTLRNVLDKWHGDAYSPTAVYELLHPVVLPASRPAEIFLYADTGKVREARTVSLGATLVDWAKRADKLDDLNTRVEARKKNPQALVPALVLQTLIDLAGQKTDSAKGHLDELSKALEKGALPQMTQLACVAAIPAAEIPQLKDPAYKVMQLAVNLPDKVNENGGGNDDVSLGSLAAKVIKNLANQPEKAKAFYDKFLAGRQAYYARYGGDYGLYIQWQDWANIARDAAIAGLPTIALDYMGRVVDYHYQTNPRPRLTTPLASTVRALRTHTPQERYETWRDWTLPAKGRENVRLIAEWTEPVTAPAAFLPKEVAESVNRDETLQSNWQELLDAAQAAGKLDELREQVQSAAEKKLPNAAALAALLQLRSGDSEAAEKSIDDLAKTLPERIKPAKNQVPPDLWAEYLVYRACLQDEKLVPLAAKLRFPLQNALRTRGQTDTFVHSIYDAATREAVDTKANFRPQNDTELSHWVPANPRELASSIKPHWLIHEGELTHLPGPGNDTLQLKYPITGNFDFAVDCFEDAMNNGEAGYGGIVVETHPPVDVATLSGHESLQRSPAMRHAGFNRVNIHVADGKLQYSINNHIVYEEEASPTSPWPMLFSHGPRLSVFRNVSITGAPLIPREVTLFSGNRLDGWNCTFYGESQPRQRFMREKPKENQEWIAQQQQQEPTETDWRVQDGILLGKAKTDLSEASPSWIYYQRPLCEGETFQFEFYYTPGVSVVHPALGRIVFELDPAGVALHWIGKDDWDNAVFGIANDNRVIEGGGHRGPDKLPLKADDWNKVALTIKGGNAVIALNGTEIYERPIDPQNNRLIGLFRDKRNAVKVRNAILTGPWPDQYNADLQRDLLTTTAKPTEADRRVVGDILDDAFAQFQIDTVLAHARTLNDKDRYEYLKSWVLPTPDHANIRTYFNFAEPSSDSETAAVSSITMVSPAVELVKLAAKLNSLDALQQEIEKLDVTSPDNCGQQMLLALIGLNRNDDAGAKKALETVFKQISRGSRKDKLPRKRISAFVAAWSAADHPAVREITTKISDSLAQQEHSKETSGGSEWGRNIDALAGKLKIAALELPTTAPPSTAPSSPWKEIAPRSVDPQLAALTTRQWYANEDRFEHVPAAANSELYFQSPLGGNFEILGEFDTADDSAIAATFGGHAAIPRHDLKATSILTLERPTRETAGLLKIPDWGPHAKFKIAVDGTKVTTFVNNTQINEEFVTPKPTPWLVLQAAKSANAGVIQNVRIAGKPEIPASLDLIETMSAPCWAADLYGEPIAMNGKNENAVWLHTGDELVGQLNTALSAKPLEAVLTYLRPLLEDGTIEYEFFFTPGEQEVHPALGRHAFLIRPNGVKLHTLTKG